MGKLVSVIMPCYNAEKYIERALNSIYEQTYKDIELICVNDGSKDNTLNILNSYHQKHSIKMKIISTENAGVSSARNTGIAAAEGEYIMFLDADDMYSNRCIELLVNTALKYEVDTAYAYWSCDIEKLGTGNNKEKKMAVSEIASHFMYRPTPVSFFSFLYCKCILDKYNIRFDVDLKYGEDNLFFWKYICHITSGIYIDCPLYWYYQNESSAMHNPSWRIVDAIKSVQRTEDWMKKYKFSYYQKYHECAPARSKFHIAKEFARYGKKEWFQKFYVEYNVKESMQYLFQKKGIGLTVASCLLKCFPSVFYFIVNRVYSIKGA